MVRLEQSWERQPRRDMANRLRHGSRSPACRRALNMAHAVELDSRFWPKWTGSRPNVANDGQEPSRDRSRRDHRGDIRDQYAKN